MIEAKDGGLFRSNDGGEKWEHVSAARVIRQRAWYYTCLAIDPTDANIVWVPQVNLVRTIDGGKSWQSVKVPQHGDHHDVWIDPTNAHRLLTGNDGGIGFWTGSSGYDGHERDVVPRIWQLVWLF